MQGTTKNLIAAVAALTVLSGCAQISESRFNPLNWFGGSSEEATTLAGDISKYQGPPDTSVQIAELVSMNVDRMPGGAIITAEGVAPIQGFGSPSLLWQTAKTRARSRSISGFNAPIASTRREPYRRALSRPARSCQTLSCGM